MAATGARGARRPRPGRPATIPSYDQLGLAVTRAAGVEDLTRADTPDPRIAWQGGPALPLERMCADTLDAPVPIAFHRAARETWQRHGLLLLLDGAPRPRCGIRS
jgi:hypothetical protein